MRPAWRPHVPTLVGRVRTDARLLLLTGFVVALVTAFTAAVGPMTDRTADRAIAAEVREAGARSDVVATFPREDEDPRGQTRHPLAAVELRQDTDYARATMPSDLAAVLRLGVASLSSTPLQLLDAGPGRYLRLVYVDPPDDGEPAVTYVAGGPPQGSVGADQAEVTVPSGAEPWPVQVAVSEAVATALGLEPGDRLPAQDEHARPVDIRVSGVFAATAATDDAWRTRPELLTPLRGISEGVERTSAAALVSAASLPDLRLAVPPDALTQRVSFAPQPSRLRWRESAGLARDVVSLKASPGLARSRISWQSFLDMVLGDGRSDVAAARGQADVLLVGLNAGALLVLVLAAQLLARRRAGSVALARERGASLAGLGAELFVEALAVAVAGVTVGLLATRALVGETGWGWSVPILVVASAAAPLLGAVTAARATDARRSPANRGARRVAARSRRVQRYLLEIAVLTAAALSVAALHQRGVTGGDDGGDDRGGDLLAASAPTWWAVAGALVVVRALPPLVRFLLVRSRRSGRVRFFALATLAQSGVRVVPQLLVVVTVAQLTFGLALAATEHRGQAAGALLAVGGDARLTGPPDPSLVDAAARMSAEPGVGAAAAGRVEDGVRASSPQSAATVRLVVVDAAAYERLLAASPLPDAPDLARLRDPPSGAGVAALVLGGDPGLRDRMVVRWDEATIPLDVVGVAPRVDGSPDPVVVVDAAAFAGSGAAADPDTVWAVGPGAASAVRAAAGSAAAVALYAEELGARRDAPLASGLMTLAVAAAALLLLFAVLGVVLAAAGDGPSRTTSLGRLRSLGLPDRDLSRVLVAELMTPVVLGALAGLVLGAGAAATMFGALDLQRVTGEGTSPVLVLPWWPLPATVALCLIVLVVVRIESSRLRRTSLAELLRAGDGRT